MSGKNGINSRQAGVTVETTLSILLAVVVLFLILGLFSNNLKEMIANSNMSRLFVNNANSKTVNQKWGVDPTKTQVDVKIVADQGLDYYLTQAQQTIAKYKATPPQNESEIEDLAKAATIAKIVNGTSGLSQEDEKLFYKSYGISIDTTSAFTTKVTTVNKIISYSTGSMLENESEKLNAVKKVTSATFN